MFLTECRTKKPTEPTTPWWGIFFFVSCQSITPFITQVLSRRSCLASWLKSPAYLEGQYLDHHSGTFFNSQNLLIRKHLLLSMGILWWSLMSFWDFQMMKPRLFWANFSRYPSSWADTYCWTSWWGSPDYLEKMSSRISLDIQAHELIHLVRLLDEGALIIQRCY